MFMFSFEAKRLADFYIDVSNNFDGSSARQCTYDNVPYEVSETRVYTCQSALYGGYVRIHFAQSKNSRLTLCKVQVLGCEYK